MTEIFNAWRSEIIAELAEAETELSAGQEALRAAEAEAASAKAERRALTDALANLPIGIPMATALRLRLQDHENRLRDADGAVVRCRGAVKLAHHRIADLRQALTQLDELTVLVAAPADAGGAITVLLGAADADGAVTVLVGAAE